MPGRSAESAPFIAKSIHHAPTTSPRPVSIRLAWRPWGGGSFAGSSSWPRRRRSPFVNAVVGGAFVALTIRGLFGAPVWVATVLGAAVALLLALAFLRYQWRAWTRSPWRCRCERGPAPAPARIHEFCLARRHLEKAERRALRVSDDREAPAREVHRRNQFARAGLRRGLERFGYIGHREIHEPVTGDAGRNHRLHFLPTGNALAA